MALQRLHLLDALRGLAALAVVFWHWQHFGAALPLETLFWLPYHGGGHAVEFFFFLSGIVFFHLYGQHLPSARTFFWLRFSRLYPLHLLTFLAMLALPAFHYPRDAAHGALHLLLLNAWAAGHSWNAPAWSISVEAFLYLCFYFVVRLGLTRLPQLAALSLIGIAIHNLSPFPQIGQGLTWFFIGGAFAQLLGRDLEAFDPAWARHLAPLGDISYSVYLLHFPLQAAFAASFPREYFAEPGALAFFFGSLLILAYLSYHTFERPAQNLIRRLALG